jgi:hypothetical protein
MDDQGMQERLSKDVNELVATAHRLADALGISNHHAGSDENDAACSECGGDDFANGAMAAQAAEHSAAGAAAVQQEIFLGLEVDQCSGQLSVRNRNNVFVTIPRGPQVTVDVAIDGQGYWYWRCGSSGERSRGEPNYRQRVKRLKITHSTDGRKITWRCFDLL